MANNNIESYEAYNTILMSGVPASSGNLPAGECTFYSSTWANIYGAHSDTPSIIWKGNITDLDLLRGSEILQFSEPVTGYTNSAMGQNTIDIRGIGLTLPEEGVGICLCPVDTTGTLRTDYKGSRLGIPACTDAQQDYSLGIWNAYIPNQGYMTCIGLCGRVDEVAHPTIFMNYQYSVTLGYFFQVGNNIFEYALHDNYWNEEDAAPDGESGGGGASWNVPDVPVDNGAIPSVSVIDTGFISLYHTTTAELQSFAQFLWSNNFFDNIKKNWSSPMENIISLHLLPISSSLFQEASANITIGNTDSGVGSHKITSSSIVDLDLGNIQAVPKYNSFSDYDGRATLYLPYVGYSEIDLSDCMDGYINVQYRIDIFTGDFVAMVYAYSAKHNYKKHCIDQKAGNMAVHFPVSGSNYMGVYTASLGAIGSIAGGNILGGTSTLMTMKPQYGKCSNIGGVSGYLGTKYPYLLFHRPYYFEPKNGTKRPYRERVGIPSGQYSSLSSCSGFIKVMTGTFEGDNIPCTSEELDMITQLLESGIRTNDEEVAPNED